MGSKINSLIEKDIDVLSMLFPYDPEDWELMTFWMRDFVLNNECVKKYVENNKEMHELFLRFIRTDRPKMKDKYTLYLFLSKCPCVVEDEEDELACSNEEDKCYVIRFLRVCETKDVGLEEQRFVWDSATDEYTEVWQKAEYKGNELKP